MASDQVARQCAAAACLNSCPVDAIHAPPELGKLATLTGINRRTRIAGLQLYIDLDPCICCAACEPACQAIFDDEAVPKIWQRYLAKNAAFFQQRRAFRIPLPAAHLARAALGFDTGVAVF